MSQDQAVLLMSSYTADNIQEVNQRRVESSFEANKIDFISIDGALPENKDVRNILFGVSEQRGKYPQVFIKGADDSYKFVGLFEAFEGLLECDQLPADVLEANPNIPTFKNTFANVKRVEILAH